MPLLAKSLLLKPQDKDDLFFVMDFSGNLQFWVNQAMIDVLEGAAIAATKAKIQNLLIKRKYGRSQVSDKFESIWRKLLSYGLISPYGSPDCHKLRFLPSLSCKNQFDNLTVCLTNQCNYDCMYCYNRAQVKLDFEPKLLHQILDQAINECGVMKVTFTGGEPLLYSDLFNAVSFVKKHHCICNILTNGDLLTPDIIKKLSALGVNNIGISIDSICFDTYRKLTNSSGNPEKIIENMRLCQNAGINVDANIVLVDGYNLDKDVLDNLLKSLNKAGIKSHIISEATPVNGKPHSLKHIQDSKFKKEIINCLGGRTCQSINADKNVDPRFCSIGSAGLVITPDGKVITCPALMEFPVGDIRYQKLKDIWCLSKRLSEIREKTLSEFTYCKECPARFDCGGGCRAKAYHYHGDLR